MVVKIIKQKKACTLLVKSAVFEQQLLLFSDGFRLPTGDMKVRFVSNNFLECTYFSKVTKKGS